MYNSVVGFLPLSQFPYPQLLEASYLFVQIFVSPPILDTFIFVSLSCLLIAPVLSSRLICAEV